MSAVNMSDLPAFPHMKAYASTDTHILEVTLDAITDIPVPSNDDINKKVDYKTLLLASSFSIGAITLLALSRFYNPFK